MKTGKIHLLIIEDNPADQRLIREMLREYIDPVFSFICAGCLAEGLREIGREKIDVVLLDVGLPDSRGLEGLDQITQRHPKIPVIVLTGADDESLGLQAIQRHASDYLTKGKIDASLMVRSIRYAIERKQAEKALEIERNNLQMIFDAVNIGMLLIDEHGMVTRVNNIVSRWFGQDRASARNLQPGNALKCIHALNDPAGCGKTIHCKDCPIRKAFESVLRSNEPVHGVETESELIINGIPISFWLDLNVDPISMDGKKHVILSINDITRRKQAEQELQQLNRTLKALSSSNQAMMRARDEASYLNEVCRIIVQDCGHAMVWIGYAEHDKDKSVRPMAHAGFEEGYLETLKISWADTEHGRGPTGTAIRTGRPSMCNDMLSDPKFRPWREEAIRRGYASSVVLPLLADGKAFGALSIYSQHPHPFSEGEIKLLAELADDLAYGIMAIRLRLAHQQAQDELRRTRDYLEKLIDHTNAPIAVWDTDFKITRFNHAFERLTGYSAGEIIGQRLEVLFPENERTAAMEKILRTLLGEFLELIEIPVRHRNGEVRHVLWNSANITDAAGKNVVATIAQGTDITERKQAEAREKEALAIAMSARTAMDMIQTMGEGVLLVDMNGHILSVNPALEQLSGFPKNETLGRPLIDFLSSMLGEKDKPMAMAAYHSSLAGENPKLHPLTIINNNGRSIPIIPSVSFIRASDGKPTAIILTVRDISEIRAAQQELEKNNARLRALAERLSSTEERERHRISAQIHDTVIQTLSIANIKMGALGRELTEAGLKDSSKKLNIVRTAIEEGIRESRSLMAELTPPLLYELGLAPALSNLGETLEKQHGMLIKVHDDGHPKPITKPMKGLLFQAARELIMNAMKHAGKCAITVTLALEKDRLRIVVEDDGAGFRAPPEGRHAFHDAGGFGLFNIRERLEGIGGSVEIRSRPGAGTCVTLLAPVSSKKAER